MIPHTLCKKSKVSCVSSLSGPRTQNLFSVSNSNPKERDIEMDEDFDSSLRVSTQGEPSVGMFEETTIIYTISLKVSCVFSQDSKSFFFVSNSNPRERERWMKILTHH